MGLKGTVQELLDSAYFHMAYSRSKNLGVPCCGSVEMNPTSIHEDIGSIPGPIR